MVLIKKAMIMSAGVGSRLNPLTLETPKPLVPVLNKPVMDILLEKLSTLGINKVIANTHYLAEQIHNRYSKNSPVDIDFSYIHEEILSGTAGGVKKCEFFFKDVDNFLVLSADGLHDTNLEAAIESHEKSGCIATMVITSVPYEEVCHYGVVVADSNNTVSEFQEKPAINEAKSNFINTGIYIFNKKIFNFIPENTMYDFAKNVFPSLLESGEKINLFKTDRYWSDIGTLEQYVQSNFDALNKTVNIGKTNVVNSQETTYTIGDNCEIAQDVIFKNNVIIGKNCRIESGAILDNVILWDNVEIKKDAKLKNVVCANNTTIKSLTYDNELKIFGANKTIELDYTK